MPIPAPVDPALMTQTTNTEKKDHDQTPPIEVSLMGTVGRPFV